MKHHGIVIALLLSGVSVAAAQMASKPAKTAPSSSGSEMLLFEDVPSVTGASKYEQKPKEAPASVTIITAEEIERFGYRNLGEVLESVRGFFTSYDRNYSYVAGRGFGPTGDYNTRVLLLIDGHRTNEGVYQATYFGNESVIDVAMIDRVEVIRGPSSSIYGTDAFLGVVNVVTKSGRAVKGTDLSLEGSSYSSYRGTVTHGNRLASGSEYAVSASYFDSGGQDLYFSEFDAPPVTDGTANGADSEQFASVFGKFTRGNLSIQGGYKSRDKTIPTAAFSTTFDNDLTRTSDTRAYVAMSYDHALTGGARLTGALSYDYYRYEGQYWYDPVMTRDYAYSQFWTAEGRYVNTLAQKHKVVAGAEFRYDAQQDQGVWDDTPYLYFIDNRSASTWGLFVQDEFRVNDTLTISAGLRHDNYESFGGTTNPRLAFIFGPTSSSTIKAIYGSAFRAPNAYEIYYNDGGATQKANPNLDPETIATYELVFEHTWRNGLRGVATAYRYAIDDLITLVVDPNDSLLVFQNVSEVQTDGLELEMEGRFHPRLEGRVSYAYQNAEDASSGARLVNSPKHLAKINLTTPIKSDRILASAEIQYIGDRLTSYGTEESGSVVTNLVLVMRELTRGMSVTAGIYNVFDEEYGDPGGTEHVQASIPQDGRNYRVTVRYQF
jgi:iron complex outermembrane receptor protein